MRIERRNTNNEVKLSVITRGKERDKENINRSPGKQGSSFGWILLHRNKEDESRGYKMSLQDYDEYNRRYVCMFICSRIKKDESRGYKMSR